MIRQTTECIFMYTAKIEKIISKVEEYWKNEDEFGHLYARSRIDLEIRLDMLTGSETSQLVLDKRGDKTVYGFVD